MGKTREADAVVRLLVPCHTRAAAWLRPHTGRLDEMQSVLMMTVDQATFDQLLARNLARCIQPHLTGSSRRTLLLGVQVTNVLRRHDQRRALRRLHLEQSLRRDTAHAKSLSQISCHLRHGQRAHKQPFLGSGSCAPHWRAASIMRQHYARGPAQLRMTKATIPGRQSSRRSSANRPT